MFEMTKNEDLKAIKGLRDIAMKMSLDKVSPNDGLNMFNLIAVLDNPEKDERIKYLEILVSAQDKIISNLATRPTVTPTDSAMEDAVTREDTGCAGTTGTATAASAATTSSTTDGDAERAVKTGMLRHALLSSYDILCQCLNDVTHEAIAENIREELIKIKATMKIIGEEI